MVTKNDTERWDKKGVVLEQIKKHTYTVQFEPGKLIFRNREKIRKWPNIPMEVTKDVEKTGMVMGN